MSRKPHHTKLVKLELTQEIIDRATRRDSTACVLADALRIAIPGSVRPLVDLQTISVTVPEKGLRYHWLTPRAAMGVLINFDQGAELTPTTIRLREGWTTPIRSGQPVGPSKKVNREERKAELEQKEAAGALSSLEARSLKTMRETDGRTATKAETPDRTLWERPPVASLSNMNGRKYGLRLTRLTIHGEALVQDLHSE